MAKPVLVVICGLMGTGKSTLARALAERVGLEVIRSDVVRKELVGIEEENHRYETFGGGIYSEKFFDATYDALFRRAEALLGAGKGVVIDASFKRRGYRERAKEIAAQHGAPFLLIESSCSDQVVKRRLETRTREKRDVSDGRWSLFKSQKADFEVISELPEKEHLRVNTDRPVEDCIDTILESSDLF